MSDNIKTNPIMKWFIIHLVVIAALAAGLYMFTKIPKKETAAKNTVVYLVRHAEKITGPDAGRDPALTPEGIARAALLAGLLADENITNIYASDYTRTRDTAAPTAEMSDVKIKIYDPRNLQELADTIKAAKGRYLVVGHSNTIPETVTALGGVGGSPIFEKSEYDRLYVVTIGQDGTVQTDLRRYGARYMAGSDTFGAEEITLSDTGVNRRDVQDDLIVSTGRISGDDKKHAKKQNGENRDARPIKRIPPVMPEIATQSGYCFMRFDVDTHGRTFNVEAYKCSDDMFANPAADSVRLWLYDPKLENGEAVIRKGITSKVTFKLSDEAGDIIAEPDPVDESIDAVLDDGQQAKLHPAILKSYKGLSKLPSSNHCCVRFDVSQTGQTFNTDVASCTDSKFVDDAAKLVRSLVFNPAQYNGKNISNGNKSVLVKFPDNVRISGESPFDYLPVLGSEEETKICQFE